MKINIKEEKIHKILCEVLEGLQNQPQNQTNIEGVILSKRLAGMIYALGQNYDLQYNYGDDLEDYADRIYDIIATNRQALNVIENFISSSRELLSLFGTEISDEELLDNFSDE